MDRGWGRRRRPSEDEYEVQRRLRARKWVTDNGGDTTDPHPRQGELSYLVQQESRHTSTRPPRALWRSHDVSGALLGREDLDTGPLTGQERVETAGRGTCQNPWILDESSLPCILTSVFTYSFAPDGRSKDKRDDRGRGRGQCSACRSARRTVEKRGRGRRKLGEWGGVVRTPYVGSRPVPHSYVQGNPSGNPYLPDPQ